MIITVRSTIDGKIRKLSLNDQHHPVLRLKNHLLPSPPQSNNETGTIASRIPGDLVRHILNYLEPREWISADSTCRRWRTAAQPLWKHPKDDNESNRRKPNRFEILESLNAEKLITKKWDKFRGYLGVGISLNGPATNEDITNLIKCFKPWIIPPTLIASYQIHDGEWIRSRGIYFGSRLLSVCEIIDTIQRWKKQQHYDNDRMILPLFSDGAGPRQIAMELVRDNAQTTTKTTGANGRVVLISSAAPFSPHFKVLATSWEGFLTLI